MEKSLKIIFAILSFFILIAGLAVYDDSLEREGMLWFIISPIYFLSFPSFILYRWIYVKASMILPFNELYGYSPRLGWVIFIWLPLVFLSYFQWFVMVPRMIYGRDQEEI